MKRRFGWLVLLSLLIVVLGAQAAAAAPSGAIFTTLPDGSRVNANIYESKYDVYLDGGPGPNAPAKAAGLDPGWYYFQVTDPSGKVLLSEDAVKYRKFYVSADGVITMAYNHVTGIDQDHSELGAITVQLMPYSDTPNPGGVYKAWAIPVDRFTGDPEKVDSRSEKFHGFDPAWSKTDNFKVKGKPEQRLIVKKFYDCNANGVWDTGEYEIYGWPLRIVEPTGITWDPIYTRVDIISQLTGTWNVTEYDKPIAGCDLDWIQTALYVDGVKQSTFPSVNVKFGRADGEVHTVVFGNVPRHTVKAKKFNDKNCNGVKDEGEEGLANVKITLAGSGAWGTYGPVSKMTDSDGYAVFDQLLPGTYTLEEEVPAGWLATTPTKIENITLGCMPICSPSTFEHEYGFGNVTAKVCATKFFDEDGDGIWDADELAVAGWTFKLTGTDLMGNSIDVTKETGSDGKVCFGPIYPGDYTLTEIPPADEKWLPSGLWYSVSGGAKVDVDPAEKLEIPLAADATWDVTFGNTKPGCIVAHKFWDKKADGVRDETDPPIEGWEITLTGTTNAGDAVNITKKTDADGYVEFCDLWPGTYKLAEDKGDPDVWFATSDVAYEGIVLKADGYVAKTFLNCKYVEIKVCKFEDKNGNGVVDAGEPKVAKFSINVTGGPDKIDVTKETGEDGCVVFDKLKPGSYAVKELIPEDSVWKPTALYYKVTEGADFTKADGTPIEVALEMESGEKGAVKFLNCRQGCIEVEKFYDRDGDGIKDGDEPPVAGVKIVLTGTESFDGDADGTAVSKTAYTDAEGKAKFCYLWPGTYSVTEVLPPDGLDYVWVATTPKSVENIIVKSAMTEGPYLFGNRCERQSCFYTKGFWHNKNGTDLITGADVAFLNSLAPFSSAAASWQFPFDGTWVWTGNTYFGEGAIGEISDFITASESRDEIPQRFQLMQQLTAYVLNVRHFSDGWDAVIETPCGLSWKAQDLLDAALAAWASADPNECSRIEKILDTYNNCNCVKTVCANPCPIPEY